MKNKFLLYTVLIYCLMGMALAHAVPLSGMRNFVLFPVKSDRPLNFDEKDVWWAMHNQLVGSQRFLVATYEYMVKKRVYQPRGELIVTDSIILGRLLGADALIVSEIRRNKLIVTFFDAKSGLSLWKKTTKLNPAFKLQRQLLKAGPQIIAEFERHLPFLGYVEPLGKGSFEVFVGLNHDLRVNDTLEFVRFETTGETPVLRNHYTVFSAGSGIVDKSQLDKVVVTGSLLGDAQSDIFARRMVGKLKKQAVNVKLHKDTKKQPVLEERPFVEPVTESRQGWFYAVAGVLLVILIL